MSTIPSITLIANNKPAAVQRFPQSPEKLDSIQLTVDKNLDGLRHSCRSHVLRHASVVACVFQLGLGNDEKAFAGEDVGRIRGGVNLTTVLAPEDLRGERAVGGRAAAQ